MFDTAITERSRRLRAVTLAGEHHAAEQRFRAVSATARTVEASSIEGLTDTDNRVTGIEPVDSDAQKRIARLVSDAPGPGRSRTRTQTLHPEQQPGPVVTEHQHDNDHGL